MIEMKNVSFAYPGKEPVLEQLNRSIEDGARVCMMAPSGRGKTTLLRLLCGSLKPDQGEITGIAGKQISMVFQEDRLLDEFTVLENINLACLRGKYRPRDQHADVFRHLAMVGLNGWENEKVCNLSGGMKRRVSIVQAILSRSDIVIMDEPFSGIDAENKTEVAAYIRAYRGDRTLILVSHDEKEAAMLEADVMTL